MSDLNLVVQEGRLTRAPKVAYTTNGNPVCEFTLAVNEKYHGQQTTLFLDVVTFGKLAESCSNHLDKASLVIAQGRLIRDEWKDKAGNDRYKIKMVAAKVDFKDRGKHNESGQTESAGESA